MFWPSNKTVCYKHVYLLYSWSLSTLAHTDTRSCSEDCNTWRHSHTGHLHTRRHLMLKKTHKLCKDTMEFSVNDHIYFVNPYGSARYILKQCQHIIVLENIIQQCMTCISVAFTRHKMYIALVDMPSLFSISIFGMYTLCKT